MFSRSILISLLLSLWGALAIAGTPMDQAVYPKAYQELLQEFVVKEPLPGGGFETRFDYAGVLALENQEVLRNEIRQHFLAVSPNALGPKARYAWASNAYNFFVIDLILENYDGGELGSISEIGEESFSVFTEPRFYIDGKRYSLNEFEAHFLFLDIDRNSDTVPADIDPRYHFAIVCAAKGCPSLWPEAFDPAKLDEQLNAVTQNTLKSPRHLRIDDAGVHVSKIFEWYAADFGGSIREFLLSYGPADLKKLAPDFAVHTDIDWDWSLNRPSQP